MLGFVIDASKRYLDGKFFACFSGVLEDTSNFIWYQEIPEILGFIKTEQKDPEKDPTLKSLWNDFVKPNYISLEHEKFKKGYEQNKIFENKVNIPLIWLATNVGVSLKFIDPPNSIKNKLRIFINPKVESALYIPAISTISIDIEVGMKSSDILDAANNTLYCIAIHSNSQSTVLMLDESITNPIESKLQEFEYKKFPTEKTLLTEFIHCIAKDLGQIFLGWNILEFDLQFLCKKIQLHKLNLYLGILGRKSSFSVSGNKDFRLNVGGRSVLDGIWLLKEMQIKLTNYKLNTTAEILINQKKTIVATDLQKIEEINFLFENDKESLAIYNFQDAILPTKILEKIDGIPFLISKSVLSKTPFSHLKSQLILTDSLYIPILRKYSFVAPETQFKIKKHSFKNVEDLFLKKDLKKGIYQNIVRIDFEEIDIFVVKNFPIDILSQTQVQTSTSEENLIKISEELFLRRDISINFDVISDWKKMLTQFPNFWKEKESVKKSLDSLYKNLLYSINSPYSRYSDLTVVSCFKKIKNKVLFQITETISQIKDLEILWIEKNFLIAKYSEPSLKDSIKISIMKSFSLLKKNFFKEFRLYTEEITKEISFFSNLFILNATQNESTKQIFSYALQDSSMNISIYPSFEKETIKLPQKICTMFLTNLFSSKSLEISLQKILQELYSGDLNKDLVYTKKLGKEFNKSYLKDEEIPHTVSVGKELGIKKSGYIVKYVITTFGAKPYTQDPFIPNYEYYKEKYIFPIYKNFRSALEEGENYTSTNKQMGFFD